MTHSVTAPPPSVGYLLWQVALKWRVAMDRALARYELTSAQYGVLASLHALSRTGARPSQRELADFSGLEPMSVSKLVRGLERAGLVQRMQHPADTRAVELVLTPSGTELVRRAAATVRALHASLLQPLGGAQSAHTSRLVDDLQALLGHATAINEAEPSRRTS
jgi:DNA-binding MarR family transcriptional regulator